jgi:hypothetical protein
MNQCIQALKNDGHEVVEIKFEQLEKLIDLFMMYLRFNFFSTALMCHPTRVNNVKGEKIVPEFKLVSLFAYCPPEMKTFLAQGYKLMGEKRFHDIMILSKRLSTSEFL